MAKPVTFRYSAGPAVPAVGRVDVYVGAGRYVSVIDGVLTTDDQDVIEAIADHKRFTRVVEEKPEVPAKKEEPGAVHEEAAKADSRGRARDEAPQRAHDRRRGKADGKGDGGGAHAARRR